MKTTSKKTDDNTPNSDLLIKAFIQHFKCNPDEIEVQEKLPGASVLVIYKSECYQIDTHAQLREDASDMLQVEMCATRVRPDMWIRIAGEEYTAPEFYTGLIRDLFEPADLNAINMAVNIANITEDQMKAFWFTLSALDRTGTVYPKAIVTAARLNDIEELTDNLLDLQIENGINFFNMAVGGIFEEVVVNDEHGRELAVYIFSQSIHAWEFPTES